MDRKRKGKLLTTLLAVSGVLLWVASSFRYEKLTPGEKILVGVARIVAAAFFVIVIASCTRIQDELQQKIMQSSLLTGLAASYVSLIFTDSLYHLAPRIVAVRDVEQFWLVTFILGYLVGHFFAKRRYAG
jgi:EamA domain-containing membrane protein RarD